MLRRRSVSRYCHSIVSSTIDSGRGFRGQASDQKPRGAVEPIGLSFDQPVADGGYLWWYLDGISDDAEQAVTVIAFVGSVFSPYYAAARRRGKAAAAHFNAINVALYMPRGKRWAMTERGQDRLHRGHDHFQVGPSSLNWDGRRLRIDVRELSVPLPRRLRGRIEVTPRWRNGEAFALDAAGRHRWQPLMPTARVQVQFSEPELSWSGTGYLDSNGGSEPLEAAFRRWFWSRSHFGDRCRILYEAETRATAATAGEAPERRLLALEGEPGAGLQPCPVPPPAALPKTLWGIERPGRAEGGELTLVRTLEDAPFYSRSLVRSAMHGTSVLGVHESLDLERFDSRWVQLLLPFRMPRRA